MNKERSIISNSTSKKSLVICTPYLENTGGTEIEALNTAVYFYDSGCYRDISLFTPNISNKSLFQSIIGDREIKMFTYPSFFLNSTCKFMNRVFFKVGFEFKMSEYIYWKYKAIAFSTFFILTYTKSSYFFPIIKAVPISKKIIGKITMGQFDILPKSHINFYRRFNKIIVFNNKQRVFWRLNYEFDQVLALDIMIPNEMNLLKVNASKIFDTNNLVFGFLGRISREKNIIDMIMLLDFLNNKNKLQCNLIIQGDGDFEYIMELKREIKALNLSEFVIFNNWLINPNQSHKYFDKIDVFLVTSIHEGGPITALEAAASGRIVLGYDIGAMSDRFSKLPFLVNKNFEELCNSARAIIKMDKQSKLDLAKKIKEHYISQLNNEQKGKHLLEIID